MSCLTALLLRAVVPTIRKPCVQPPVGDCCLSGTGERLACCESLSTAPSPSTSTPPQLAGCRGNSSKATPAAAPVEPGLGAPAGVRRREVPGLLEFFTEFDPTGGYVTYVSEDEAAEYGLYNVWHRWAGKQQWLFL
eukprot:CAMPEP_0179027808 /NCGR_PEP_ID=MMETSP0796-20121207/9225_1 /TAXON_ID=73915 /ORGANISM="Pyrodinium bahamense, Strain pbaha01" /LENGTH=135 /DNA_ID=CAMNT_0020723939 /DNA_START=77 /DNA_END=485 /DNA_ORIENTATION=+